ncbi:MAG: C25 family cysteine peptidase [Bacteroidales bacterium]|nr:C25 family cysteine peptidase [Bacteroidales bacterium]
MFDKKNIRIFFVAVALFLNTDISFCTNNLNSQKTNSGKIELVSSDLSTTVISYSLDDFTFVKKNVNNKTEYSVNAGNATPILIAGAPDLVKFTSSILVPDMDEMQAEVISSNYKEYSNISIAPSKGNLFRNVDPEKVPYKYGEQYSNNEFFPGKLTALKEPYILRDYRGQTLVVYPFQYNPVTKILRVYFEMTIRISSKSKNGKNQFHRTKNVNKVVEEFNDLYSRHFLNYNSSKYTPLTEKGNILIICYGQFMAEMQAFVNWKKTEGIPCEIKNIDSIGNTASDIRAFVANYYNTKGLAFLVLAGDAAQIPTNDSLAYSSDNAYGYIAGADVYSEIIIGRISAENISQVRTQVRRFLEYEKNPAITGAFARAIGIASNQGPGDNNEYDWEHERNIRNELLNYNYNYCAELYDGSHGGDDAANNPSASSVASEINNGAGIINYTGHGSTYACTTSNFSNTYVNNSLNNINCLPFIFSVACVNGDFDGKTCFAEAWLRATDVSGNPKGAVAALMSTVNQSWDPPMSGQDEMVNIITESYPSNIKHTFGGISFNGINKMLDDYSDTLMADTWTIFGDPSLMLRTDTPKILAASHFPSIMPGTISFDVNSNVEGASVALTRKNNYDIIGTGTISGGKTSFTLPLLALGDTIRVCCTEYNYVPYIGEFIVCNTLSLSMGNDTICRGEPTTVTANAICGTNYYSYSWSNTQTTSAITVSPDSTTIYSVTVIDAASNQITGTIVVTVNPVPQITDFDMRKSLCLTCNDGIAEVNVNGGTPPYTYLWSTSPRQTNVAAVNLHCGNYSVTVTDVNGCARKGETAVGCDRYNSDTSEVIIYPNPNNGEFTIDFLFKNVETVNIKIYNLAGEIILSDKIIVNKVQTNLIDMKSIADGIYFMEIKSDTKKFLKKIAVQK